MYTFLFDLNMKLKVFYFDFLFRMSFGLFCRDKKLGQKLAYFKIKKTRLRLNGYYCELTFMHRGMNA